MEVSDEEGNEEGIAPSQSTVFSERTFTLSSPSQKLWLSSQETNTADFDSEKQDSEPSCSNMNEKEFLYCPEIDAEVLLEGENVVVSKEAFDKLMKRMSSHCDLKEEVSRLRAHCFEKFGKRGNPVSDPAQFKELCKNAGANNIFDALLNAMTTERQSDNRKSLNELRAMSIIYTLIYGQSQQANWFQVATTRTLKGLGVSDRGVEALRNMGLAAHPVTVSTVAKEIAADHLESVKQVFDDAVKEKKFIAIFIDDYHNIHTHHRPSTSKQTQVLHMATLLIKVFPTVAAIDHQELQVNDPKPVNTDLIKRLLANKMSLLSKTYVDTMPDWLQTKFYDPESERHRLLIHDYQQLEARELRSMKNCKLVDCIELPLKSYDNFLEALKTILENGLSTYLEHFVVPFIGDWPAQFYVRQMVYKEQALSNLVPFIGPLHISLNAREIILMKFHKIFSDLYAFLFSGAKALAMKPKPWRVSFLLEIMYGGWTVVRDQILGVFANSKDVEFLTLVNLLDTYIPLSLSIYSVIFKNNMSDLYYDSLLRCWIMFAVFRRRHYDKAPLIGLSNIEHWKTSDHPILTAISSSLSAFDEYPVENFHSLLRARTKEIDDAKKINLAAREIDARKHELHDFHTTFVPSKKYSYSKKKIQALKLRAAEFLTKKFGCLIANPGQAKQVSKNDKKQQKTTKWKLPNLFGSEKVMKNEVLPLGYLSPCSQPDPLR